MNRIQLAQLRDIAIEHLPAAQKFRDDFKRWSSFKSDPARYALSLWELTQRIRADATLPAVEIAAAQLLEAVASAETYDPNSPELQDIPHQEYLDFLIRRIADAVKTLSEVTGKEIPFNHADAPAAKGEAKPAKSQSADDWKVEARRLAIEYLDKHKKMDLFPSQSDVCKYVADAMRDKGIFGRQGKPLEANYIQRNAIQGEWWQGNAKR